MILKNIRGIELALNTVIIMAILLIVLIVVVAFFLGATGTIFGPLANLLNSTAGQVSDVGGGLS